MLKPRNLNLLPPTLKDVSQTVFDAKIFFRWFYLCQNLKTDLVSKTGLILRPVGTGLTFKARASSGYTQLHANYTHPFRLTRTLT